MPGSRLVHLFLLPLFLLVWVADARADMFTLLSTLMISGVEYTVAIIEPDDGISSISDAERALAKKIRTDAKTWVGEQYATFYSGSEAEFAKARAFGSSDGERETSSTLLVIFRGKNTKSIQATLEVASPHALGGPTPSELEFNRMIGETSVGLQVYPTVSNPWKSDSRISRNFRVSGAKVEIKKFVTLQTTAADREWAPLLVLLSEAAGLTDRAVPQSFLAPGARARSVAQLYPDRYTIVAMKKMVPYYERMGFKKVSEESLSGELYGLSISREDYVAKLLPHFENRAKGKGLLSGMTWDHSSLFKQLECPETLTKTFAFSCAAYLKRVEASPICPAGVYFRRASKFQNY